MNLRFLSILGPGLLFAGAAIGNSHLVQSTRAGAVYGLGLLLLVIFVNLIKYPLYRFGPQYTVATGKSLIAGYRQLGRPVVGLFIASEVFVQAIIIAASAITTAAVATALFELSVDPRHLAVGLIGLGAALMITGGYKLLDGLNKVLVAVLTVATVLATILVLPNLTFDISPVPIDEIDVPTFVFMVALMGFMPAGANLSVLHSLWVVAKQKQLGQPANADEVRWDTNIGYFGSAFLAVCFLIMGAAVMHTANIAPEAQAGPFASQLLKLYTSTLGEWSGIVIGVSILSVIFTTLIAVLDGFPRTLASSVVAFQSDASASEKPVEGTKLFYGMMALLIAGAVVTLLYLMGSFRDFIDFVTITSFVVAPVIAVLNHMVIHGPDVPNEHRPSTLMRNWSLAGIVFLTGASLAYFYLRTFVQ